MRLRILAATFIALLCIAPSSVVAAQGFSNPSFQFPQQQQPTVTAPSGPLGLDIKLGVASGDDYVGLTAPTSSFDYSFSDELGNSIADALGVPRSRSSVGEEFDEFDATYEYDTVVRIEDRLTRADGDNRVLEVNAVELARVARTWQYQQIDLSVCSAVPILDQSTRPGGDEDECRTWRFSTVAGDSANPGNVKLIQSTDVSSYWSMIAISAVVVGILTLLFSLLTWLLRRGPLKYFGGGVLAVIGALTFFAVVAWGVGALVLTVTERPVADFVVGNDLGSGGAFVAHVLPTLLYALPFVGPALVLSWAKPKPPASAAPQASAPTAPAPSESSAPAAPVAPQPASAAPTSEVPGIPSWLEQPKQQPPTPALAPQPETQQPQQQADDGDQPPSWRPPS